VGDIRVSAVGSDREAARVGRRAGFTAPSRRLVGELGDRHTEVGQRPLRPRPSRVSVARRPAQRGEDRVEELAGGCDRAGQLDRQRVSYRQRQDEDRYGDPDRRPNPDVDRALPGDLPAPRYQNVGQEDRERCDEHREQGEAEPDQRLRQPRGAEGNGEQHPRIGGRVRLVEGQWRVAAQMVERFTDLNQNSERLFATPEAGLNR
jgi:hypothetical protein